MPDGIFTKANCRKLVKILLDSPGDMLSEIRATFSRQTLQRPGLSSLCKAIKKAGFSRKKVAAPPQNPPLSKHTHTRAR